MSPRRLPSRPDAMPAPESVYQTLHEHEDRLDQIERNVDGLRDAVKGARDDVKGARDDVKEAVREIKSSNSSETRKMIMAIAVAALTTFGGIFGASRLDRPAAPVAIPRSALDVNLDECRKLKPGSAGREECTARVLVETDH